MAGGIAAAGGRRAPILKIALTFFGKRMTLFGKMARTTWRSQKAC